MPDPQKPNPRVLSVTIPGGGTYEADLDLPPSQLSGGAMVHSLMNPELAAILATVSGNPLAPPLAAAGMSAARDWAQGENDPKAIGGKALVHGAVNAIPGAVQHVMTRGMMPAAADVVSGTMAAGPKGGIAAALKSALGLGSREAAPSAEAGTTILGDRLVSPEGVAHAKNQVLQLAGTGKAFGDPQFDAAQSLYEKLQTLLEGRSPTELAQDAGLPVATAASKAAAATKAKAGSVALRLRQALGIGSEATGQ